MKNLKDILEASILGDIEDILRDGDNAISKKEIEDFLKKVYYSPQPFIIEGPDENNQFIVNNESHVILKNGERYNVKSLNNGLPFTFGTVKKYFQCSGCKTLISLEGAPDMVLGSGFYCSDCENLLSLKGGPRYVANEFNCSGCTSLTSLEGSPECVSIYTCMNNNLINLKGITQEVLSINVNCSGITSLEGAPEYLSKGFYCTNCKSLTSLKGAPKEVFDFKCSECNSLKTLEGAPKKVERDFICSRCNSLKTLEGAPKFVGNTFDCSKCKSLTSLECTTKKVNEFICTGCKSLTTLDGMPNKIMNRLSCTQCGTKFSLDYINSILKIRPTKIFC